MILFNYQGAAAQAELPKVVNEVTVFGNISGGYFCFLPISYPSMKQVMQTPIIVSKASIVSIIIPPFDPYPFWVR